jgi:hypothetical protein
MTRLKRNGKFSRIQQGKRFHEHFNKTIEGAYMPIQSGKEKGKSEKCELKRRGD